MKNPYYYYDTYATITLFRRNKSIAGFTKIDLPDVEKCCNIRWYMQEGYASSVQYGKLHNYLLNRDTSSQKIICDHINQDRLDNRRFNLRITNQSINAFNSPVYSNNISGTKGVRWHKRKKKWFSRITFQGKQIHLGVFDDEEDAITARKHAELKYFIS